MTQKTPLTEKTILYSDFFTDFSLHPRSLDLAKKTNEDAVKQSIKNLLLTDRGERLFQPDVGSDLRKMLFENMNPQTILLVKEFVEETINTYEPRANLIDVLVTPIFDRNEISVSIYFNVINKQEPVQLNVILDRIR